MAQEDPPLTVATIRCDPSSLIMAVDHLISIGGYVGLVIIRLWKFGASWSIREAIGACDSEMIAPSTQVLHLQLMIPSAPYQELIKHAITLSQRLHLRSTFNLHSTLNIYNGELVYPEIAAPTLILTVSLSCRNCRLLSIGALHAACLHSAACGRASVWSAVC